MRKINYKMAVVLLIAGLLFTGCQDTDPVVTIGESEFYPGVYLSAQLDAYYEVYADFSYNSEFLDDSYEDGTTATDKITLLTDEALKKMAYAKVNFDDAGKTLSDDELLLIEQNFDYLYTDRSEFYDSNGIGEDSYYSYLISLQKFRVLYEEQYYGDGELAPDIEELAEYYGNTYTPITRIDVSLLSTEYAPLEEAVIAEQKEIAEDILAALEDNEDFDAVVEEFIPKVYENTGAVYTEDQPEQYYSDDLVSTDNTTYTAEDIELISSQEPGTVGMIETDDRIIIYRVNEDYEDISEIEVFSTTLTDEIYYDAFEDAAIEEASGYPTTSDTAARSYYSPSKVQ